MSAIAFLLLCTGEINQYPFAWEVTHNDWAWPSVPSNNHGFSTSYIMFTTADDSYRQNDKKAVANKLFWTVMAILIDLNAPTLK